MTLKVSEIFYSIQGEGPNIGTPSVFLRLSGCNLRCKFCDTPYTWNEGKEISVEEVAKEILKYKCRNLVITGGESLLQQKELIEVLEILLETSFFFFFEVETNGSITPDKRLLELIDSWVISPKLSNSGTKPYKIGEWFFNDDNRGQKYLKFVVDNVNDLLEIQEYLLSNENFGALEDEEIFLMPQAVTVEEHNLKLQFIIEFAKKFGYRVSPRLQILAYGGVKRGV